MRKVLSIPLILLVLLTGVTVNIATHYCGDNFAVRKISLSGEVAGCGMEIPGINTKDYTISDPSCCRNVQTSFTFCSNYIPSSFFLINSVNQPVQLTDFNTETIESIERPVAISFTDSGPPGLFNPSRVDLGMICTLRI
jgi:hypothetical protein